EQNIDVGVAYLAYLHRFWRGNEDKIISSYNAGEGAVRDHKADERYPDVLEYKRKFKVADATFG
ncbi:lytic transglycosylase domain-containing protein, partial [Candidatus Woesearchaeota archaeon]|nr:lytic transglycosylase domain-containing protein [Candidatus Woesearchaeota archaeon]